MIVTCVGCETNFHVEDRLIKPTGSKVRCSKCRHVFTAYSPAALAEPEEPLILSEELPSVPVGKERVQASELESKLDALFGQGSATAAEVSTDQEPELLDVDDLLAEDESFGAAPPAAALGEDLQLGLDLGLSLEADAAGKRSAAEPAVGSGSEVPDIDFKLGLESPEEAKSGGTLASLEELGIQLEELEAAPAPGGLGAAEGADLVLDLDLDAPDAESVKDQASEPAETKLEEDLVAAGLSAASGAEGVLTEVPPPGDSELDLSDLEKMLEGDWQGLEPKTFGAAESANLELQTGVVAPEEYKEIGDLEELDLTPIAGQTVPSGDSAEQADMPQAEIDLTADISSDAEIASAPSASPEFQADALDFTDITSILEETPAAAANDAPEIDLFLEDGQPAETVSTTPPRSEAQDDLMLDIESLLEDEKKAEAPAAQTPAESAAEIDLDLLGEPVLAGGEDLEIEIEPAEEAINQDTLEEEAAAVAAVADSGPEAMTDHFATEEFRGTEPAGATNVLELAPAVAAVEQAAAAPRRSGVSKLLMAVLGVLVLAIAAIVVPRSLEIDIPFLSDLEIPLLGKIFQAQPEDPVGNLKMAPLAENLTAEFINNAGAGRLCVVKGQVRNNYDHPRSAVRVTAKLYTKDKALAKTTTVFAGNVLSNPELATLDLAAIAARLKNKDGANNINVGVKPGRTVPFMAVFDNLPNNLDEYSVEVAGSSK